MGRVAPRMRWDTQRLSPLGDDHITILGRYQFVVPASVSLAISFGYQALSMMRDEGRSRVDS